MCRVVKTISEKQKLFEAALGKALEEHLQERTFLTNIRGEKFFVGEPASRGVCLTPYNNENLPDALLDSNANFHPNLHVRAFLRLKKEEETNYCEAVYYILIHGDRNSIGGNSDYELKQTNEGYKMIINRIDHCVKDEDRLY